MIKPILPFVASLLGFFACQSEHAATAPATPARTTIIPGPGVVGYQFTKDGKRLAYSKFIDGKAAVFVANADGSNAKRVSFGIWDFSPMWSPDGKWIVFGRDAGGQSDVLIVPSDSGAERAVAATSAHETVLAWLPDGSGVLFSKGAEGGQETWVYNLADGKSTKEIAVAGGSVYGYPSPDGKSIAYTLQKDGKSTVWLWDREKKASRQLTTEGFESLNQHAFSPDGKSLLFYSARTGTGDVWRMDVATGEKKQLTKDIAEDQNARWSPDGTRVVFSSNRGGQVDLWVITNDESDVVRLTDDGVFENEVKWAADGKSVYASVQLGQQHMYALAIDGGPPKALTSGNWYVSDADVSADGSMVAYSGTKNGDEDVWVVKATGGEPKLVSSAPGYDGGVDLAPDNKHVAFTSYRSGNQDIWVAPIDSGPAVQLTKWPSTENGAEYSPDGKTILFLSNRESSTRDLWSVPAAGGEPTRLTRVGNIQGYRWSPDSKSIAIHVQQEAGPVVMMIPATGGTPKLVAKATSLQPRFSHDGKELSMMQCANGYCTMDILTPDGKPLRVPSAPRVGVYEFDLRWSKDDKQTLVSWQNLKGDGGNRVDLRPRAGGASKTLTLPAGFSASSIGFGDNDRVAIAYANPHGNALQRIEVPAAKPATANQ